MSLRVFRGQFVFAALLALLLTGAEWVQFRGPGGLGESETTDLPLKWSSSENIAWKTELPGAGTSSPIVVDGRVFLTCYSGYGLDEADPGSQNDLMRHVVCLDRKTGKIAWSKKFDPVPGESRYQGNGARHGYSSSTPTSDGERLYVFFGKSGVYCLDLDGNELWHESVGIGTNGWGSSNSPLLYKNLLIINASIEDRSLVALDKATGKQVWRTEGIRGSWNTPLLVPLEGGATELVVSIPEKILGFNPDTGEQLWSCEGIPDRGYVCPSAVADEGVVYVIGGRKNTAIAVKAGGRGDVTESHQLWKVDRGSNVSSPVLHDGHLYWVHEGRGVAYCLDAQDGKIVFEERLSPRPGLIYSSLMLADGRLYAVSQHNGTYVLAAKPDFELLAHNVFEDDDSRGNVNPVVSDGQLLLRNDRHLYCIGK